MSSQLSQQFTSLKDKSLLKLFKESPQRSESFTLELPGVYLDYSKNHITQDTLSALCKFAESKNMAAAVESLLKGEQVNNTEKRSALHSALRRPDNQFDSSQQIQAAQKKMETFAYTHVFPRTPIYFQRATGCPTRMKRVSRRASPLQSRATASESGNALDTSMPKKNTFQTMTSLASMAAIFAYHHILKYFEARKNTRLESTVTVYYTSLINAPTCYSKTSFFPRQMIPGSKRRQPTCLGGDSGAYQISQEKCEPTPCGRDDFACRPAGIFQKKNTFIYFCGGKGKQFFVGQTKLLKSKKQNFSKRF